MAFTCRMPVPSATLSPVASNEVVVAAARALFQRRYGLFTKWATWTTWISTDGNKTRTWPVIKIHIMACIVKKKRRILEKRPRHEFVICKAFVSTIAGGCGCMSHQLCAVSRLRDDD